MNLIKQTDSQVLKDHPCILEGVNVLLKVGSSYIVLFVIGCRWDNESPIHLDIYGNNNYSQHDLTEFYILP